MDIGVPKDRHRHEHRVGLNPFGVARLTNLGHQVYVESGAGDHCFFTDADYRDGGAEVVYSAEEVYQRAELICRVRNLDAEDVTLLRPGSTIAAFHHLAVTRREVLGQMIEREITAVGYEIIEDPSGHHPVLISQGEIAGRMAVHLAAQLLSFEEGGRGIVLGGVPGDAPATVVILGAGTVGRTAAKVFAACGAHTIVLDESLDKLRAILTETPHNIVTALASKRNLARFSAIADVLVGCVLIPGGRAPYLVTEEMVKGMKSGAVILDISIDQGGCIETSRPTTLDNPTYKLHGVTHYCVANMTTSLPRSATRVLTISALPYLTQIAEAGLTEALRQNPGLAKGVYLYKGRITNGLAASAQALPFEPLESLIAEPCC